MKIYSFEKLDVWQRTREFTKKIYILTKTFPSEEKYGLISQIRRATISISCNIVEGTSRWSAKEKARYIEIAYGSLMEVLNCLILCSDLDFMKSRDLDELRLSIDEIGNKLHALAKSYQRM